MLHLSLLLLLTVTFFTFFRLTYKCIIKKGSKHVSRSHVNFTFTDLAKAINMVQFNLYCTLITKKTAVNYCNTSV